MCVIIRFKSGFELPITCDEFKLKTHGMTGEITEYEIKGTKDNAPMFFRAEDVECIFRNVTSERIEDGCDPGRL